MPIIVSCECGKRFRARDELAGRRAKCPNCGAVLTIPKPLAAPKPPEPQGGDEFERMFSASDPYEVANEPAPPAKLPPAPMAAAPLPPPPPPVTYLAPAPSIDASGRTVREWLYLSLILALIPLAFATFHTVHESLGDRLDRQFKAHPEQLRAAREVVLQHGTLTTEEQIIDALPGHRLDGALLDRRSTTHWVLAFIAAGAFFGIALLLLPASSTKPQHAFFTGLFTGTAGVLLLLGVQFIAGMMRGRIVIPRSVLGLFLLILKGIQLSYDAANDPNSNFVLSALGFTFGVGLCEELCKALPLLWHYRTRATLDWRGACLWGFLSGAGFGVSEAIMYSGNYYNGISGGDVYLVRFVSCVALHGIWAAAAGIFIWKHQNLIQDAESWYNVFFSAATLVCVPMVLHGLYDTMLKKEMNAAALVVALISFGWLVFQVEQARRADDHTKPAYA